MTTKEKVIRESILRVEKRIKEIKYITDLRPIEKLIKLRNELSELFEENKTVEQRTSVEFIKKINEFSKKEKFYIKQSREFTGQKMIDLMDEEFKLSIELIDLKSELFRCNPKNTQH